MKIMIEKVVDEEILDDYFSGLWEAPSIDYWGYINEYPPHYVNNSIIDIAKAEYPSEFTYQSIMKFVVNGGGLQILDVEDFDEFLGFLCYDNLIKGFQKFYEEGWEYEYDSESVDLITQYALFGEVVYG